MTDFSFAFQPIVDVERREVWAYEALVRGVEGESAYSILSGLTPAELVRLDRRLRRRALGVAAGLGCPTGLAINVVNDAMLEESDPLAEAISTAGSLGFAASHLIFEISEQQEIRDPKRFVAAIASARSMGAKLALDDFGAGYSGLNLLAEFQPDLIKLDRILVADIWKSGPRQAIVRGVMRTCEDLGIEVIAEGIEEVPDFEWLHDLGVRIFQGYLFGRPAFEAFEQPVYPPFA